MKLVGADLKESERDFEDTFVKQLQETMREVKVSREMGARYVIFQEMLRDERKAGFSEGKSIGVTQGRSTAVLELLEEFGSIPGELCERIQREDNLEVLKKWNKLAAKVSSIEEFQKNM